MACMHMCLRVCMCVSASVCVCVCVCVYKAAIGAHDSLRSCVCVMPRRGFRRRHACIRKPTALPVSPMAQTCKMPFFFSLHNPKHWFFDAKRQLQGALSWPTLQHTRVEGWDIKICGYASCRCPAGLVSAWPPWTGCRTSATVLEHGGRVRRPARCTRRRKR